MLFIIHVELLESYGINKKKLSVIGCGRINLEMSKLKNVKFWEIEEAEVWKKNKKCFGGEIMKGRGIECMKFKKWRLRKWNYERAKERMNENKKPKLRKWKYEKAKERINEKWV